MTQNRKVREQSERADRILAQVYGTTEQAPVIEQEQQQEQAPPEQVQEQVQAKPVEDWEQKYRVLQGKYSAEVPRMADEIRELKVKLTSLEDELVEERHKPTAAMDLKGMTPESVVEQFGDDFAAAVGAIASKIAEQQGNKFRDEIAPKVEEVAKSTARNQRQEFMRELGRLVPNYKEIDLDEGFTRFLDEVDRFSGRSRRSFFNEADKQNDSNRVAEFFLAYEGNKPPVEKQKAVEIDPRMSVDNHLAPSTSKATSSPQGKKYWTRAEINQFYRDCRVNKYTAEQARQIETDIFAADREGRLAA